MITRRDVVVAVAAACVAITAMVMAETVVAPVMKSSVFTWDSLKAEAKPTGTRRGVFDSRTATLVRFECHITTVNPGQMPHAGHHHPEEELIVVREGTIEAVQNTTTNTVGPGGIIFEASNEYHSLRNIGQTPATYYVIKWFPPGMAKTRVD